MTNFQDIFDQYRQTPDIVIRSKAWFDQQTTLLSRAVINERLLFNTRNITNRLIPGRFYLYYYDPKHKATLPYYDRFPLMIPYDLYHGGFIGLNFHYLSYYHRVRLLTFMMRFATMSNLDDRTRILYNWSMIKHISTMQLAKHCIKRYLFSHVRSTFIEVLPKDWPTAMMLPVARFAGRKEQLIWNQNSRITR